MALTRELGCIRRLFLGFSKIVTWITLNILKVLSQNVFPIVITEFFWLPVPLSTSRRFPTSCRALVFRKADARLLVQASVTEQPCSGFHCLDGTELHADAQKR